MSGPSQPPSEKQNRPMVIDSTAAFERLNQLLKTQLALAQRGRLDEVESLSTQNQECLEALRDVRAADPSGFAHQVRPLEQLYDRLCLTLAAQGHEITESLSAVVQGKRLLRAYGKHVS